MAIEVPVQRLYPGDVILIVLADGQEDVEAKVVRDIERTDSTIRATLRAEGHEDFDREWPIGDLVTVVRGP